MRKYKNLNFITVANKLTYTESLEYYGFHTFWGKVLF